MTDKKDDEMHGPKAGAGLSRRSLLAGSAGLTFAGALGGQALAQAPGGAAVNRSAHMSYAGQTALAAASTRSIPG